MKLLSQAHDMGCLEAVDKLGGCYYYGCGEKDLETFYKLYMKPASGGWARVWHWWVAFT